MGKRFEFVDDDILDDKLVEQIAHREAELADYEDVIEGMLHMLTKAADYVPQTGDEKLDAANLQWFENMVRKDLTQAYQQHAKSKGIYGALKMRADKNPERYAAAKARRAAKKP